MTDRKRAASQRNRGLAVLFNLSKRCAKLCITCAGSAGAPIVTTALISGRFDAAFRTAAPPSECPISRVGAMPCAVKLSTAAYKSPTLDVKFVFSNSPRKWPKPVKSNRKTAYPIVVKRAATLRAAVISFEQVKQWANTAVARCAPLGKSRRAARSCPPWPGKLNRSVRISGSLHVKAIRTCDEFLARCNQSHR